MDLLDKISFLILLDETAEVRQLLENLVNLKREVYSEISIGILPFISSLSEGILHFLPEEYLEEFPKIGKKELKNIIAGVRVSYKQYSDKKFNKATKSILMIQEIFYSQMTKNFNIFDQQDLGVFYYKGIPYANTNQYHIYLESILSKTDRKELPYFSNEASSLFFEYSKNLGALINSTNLKTVLITPIKSINSSDFVLKDFFLLDKKRRNFLTGSLPLEIQLFLFNILCQNNFILYVIPDILKSKEKFFTRSLIQCYLVSITALRLVYKKYSSSLSNFQKEQFSKIIDNKEKHLNINQSFRNNVFHYKISNVPLEVFSNPDEFFEELIEFHSNKSFKDYQELLVAETIKINNLINSLMQ
ncbi:TPA: hypothetical protein U1B62_000867 [Streptococcus suis]|nr:hypothetical protein [Streptococcus suis]